MCATSNSSGLVNAIGSAKSVKLGLASSPDASSAWFKTVVDPAHAREYGCRGIPDENHEPTLVLQFRETNIVRSGTFTGTTSSGASFTFTEIRDVYLIQVFGSITSNVWEVVRGVNEAGAEVIYTGALDISNGAWSTVNWPQARSISNSLTVDWIGTELNRGGYFEAAYLPLEQSVGSSSSGTVYSYAIDLSKFGTYTSYTASSDQGAYIVGAINSYDQYRWWRSGSAPKTSLSIKGPNGGTWLIKPDETRDLSMEPYGVGTRVSVVRFVPPSSTSEFVIRHTANLAVEVMASPARGGSDGASYDPSAVEMYRTLVDQMTLIFPASYNDLGTLWAGLKGLIPKIPSVMRALTGFVPNLKHAKEIFKLWLEGVPVADAIKGVVNSARVNQAGGYYPGAGQVVVDMAGDKPPVGRVSMAQARKKRSRALARAALM